MIIIPPPVPPASPCQPQKLGSSIARLSRRSPHHPFSTVRPCFSTHSHRHTHTTHAPKHAHAPPPHPSPPPHRSRRSQGALCTWTISTPRLWTDARARVARAHTHARTLITTPHAMDNSTVTRHTLTNARAHTRLCARARTHALTRARTHTRRDGAFPSAAAGAARRTGV